MRIAAAAATIAACVLVSFAVGGDDAAPLTRFANISGASAPASLTNVSVDKQGAPAKPGARPGVTGNDSCRWANDNECDDPDIGTGACAMGTDYSDCRRLRTGAEDDSCQWARDGECDEPGFGTGACVQGSDRTDCGAISWMRNQSDRCTTSFNGICEEPGHANGSCAERTDRSDCHGRTRPLTINDHFFGTDDRVRVNAQQAPWRFMGRFTNAQGEACSATLIARDVIVTAAHCIHVDSGVTSGGRFISESSAHEARGTAYLIDRNFDYRRFNTTDEIDGLDWALIRLERPLGDQLGFAGVRNITGQGTPTASAAELFQAGYSWDTGDTLSANIGCRIVDTHPPTPPTSPAAVSGARIGHTFAHECDTTRGDSGSGFLVRNGQSFDIIGVDSNFRTNPNGPFIYIAVSAASFQPFVADFVAGRTGVAFGSSGGRRK
jgi:protease YdgD